MKQAILAALFLVICLEYHVVTGDVLIPNFRKSIVWKDLEDPVALRFASTGKIYVAHKGGKVILINSIYERFQSSSDYHVLVDMNEEVFDWWDRGLSGIALHPQFPQSPYIFLWYSADVNRTHNQSIWEDACPSRLCKTLGRLTRLTLDTTGTELIAKELLLETACSYSPSHHTGDAKFGPDGYLYLSIGDGSLIDGAVDTGAECKCPSQYCTGGFRSQDSSVINGKLLRIDPEALMRPSNPDNDTILPEDIHIVAKGFRNVYRFMFDPYNNDAYLGDVGEALYEEINRVRNLTDHSQPEKNYGWPCWEGSAPMPGYASLESPICDHEASYFVQPFFAYKHETDFNPSSPCPTGTSAVTGMLIYSGTRFPQQYQKGLLFADFARKCGWFFFRNANGEVSTSTVQTFWRDESHVVDLQLGPDGAIYMVQVFGGIISKIQYLDENSPPEAIISADKLDGPTPLVVTLNATDSYSFNSTIVEYSWDINNDGVFGDRDTTLVSMEFIEPGVYPIFLLVKDARGRNATSTISVTAAYQINFEARFVINGIAINWTDTWINNKEVGVWKVNDTIDFYFSAMDQNFLQIPDDNLAWSIRTPHCYLGTCGAEDSCHEHVLQSGKGGSATFSAQPHEWPSYLVFHLQATHPDVALKREFAVPLWPLTTEVTFTSYPPGMILESDGFEHITPFQKRLIPGVRTQITLSELQILGDTPYNFTSWNLTGQEYEKSIIFVPNPGETITAMFSPTSIDTALVALPTPTNLIATPGYKRMTLDWVAPQLPDTTSLLYYRLYWKLTNGSLDLHQRTLPSMITQEEIPELEWFSEYKFELSAITSLGETDVISVVASTLRTPPPDFNDPCIPIVYVCDLKDFVVNDYNDQEAWYVGQNNFDFASDTDGTMNSFTWAAPGYSVITPKATGSYYYEVLSTSTQCFNASKWNSLVVSFIAPVGSKFSITFTEKLADCFTQGNRAEVDISKYVLPTGQLQEARIALSEFSGIDISRLNSIMFQSFSPYRTYRLDSVYFSECTDSYPRFPTLIINDFTTAISTNNFGQATQISGFASKYAIETPYLKIVPGIFSLGFAYTNILANGTCFNASSWTSLQIVVEAPYASSFLVSLTQSAACASGGTEITVGVPSTDYGFLDSTYALVTIPLTAFTGIDSTLLTSLSLSNFSPIDVTFSISSIRFTKAKGSKVSISDSTPWLPCTNGLMVDDFLATKATNDLGFATDTDGSMATWEIDPPGRLILSTGSKSGSYFYTTLGNKQCFNALNYRYLELFVVAPAGVSFVVRLSMLLADCVTRDTTVDTALSITKYATFDETLKRISIPLIDFPGVNLTRLGSVTLASFPANANTTIYTHQIRFTCEPYHLPEKNCTGVSPLLVADLPRTNNLNDLGGETATGDNMKSSNVNGTFTVSGLGYVYTVLPTCINTDIYKYVQMDLAAPTTASFSLSLSQKYPNCTGRDPNVSTKLRVTDYNSLNPAVMTRFSFPLADFGAINPNLLNSFTLTDFSGSYSTKIDLIRFTCENQPSRTAIGACQNPSNQVVLDLFTAPLANYLNHGRPDMSSSLVAQYHGTDGVALISSTTGDYFIEDFGSGRDFSAYFYLQFEFAAPADSLLRMQIQSRISGILMNSNILVISNYVLLNNSTQLVVIPLADVVTVNWANVTRISFGDFTPNVLYTFSSLSLLCTDVPPTTQGLCTPYTIADFSSGNDSLSRNTIGGDTNDDKTMKWITVTNGQMQFRSVAGVSYWYTDFTTGGCLDGGRFNAFTFNIQAPADTQFDVRIMQKGPDCVKRESWVDYPLTNFITLDGTYQKVVIPISAMAEISMKLLHAMAFVNFGGNYTVTVDNLRWECVRSVECNGLKLIDYTLGGVPGANLFGRENGQEFLKSVQMVGTQLKFQTAGVSGAYWYSDMGCTDLTSYNTLQMVIRASRNTTFNVRFSFKDSSCSTSAGSSNSVTLSGFDGTSTLLSIPLSKFGSNLKKIGSIVLNNFGTTNYTIFLESIVFCGNPPSCTSFVTVNDFLTSTTTNNLGLTPFASGMKAQWLSANQFILTSTATSSIWVTPLAQPTECCNIVSYEALAVEVKGVPMSSFGIQLGTKNTSCTGIGSGENVTLPSAKYLKMDGTVQLLRIPLTDFGVNLSRADYVAFTNFAPNPASFQFGEIAFCSLDRTTLPSPSPTPSVTPTPSRTASPSISPIPSVTPTSSVSPTSSPTPSPSSTVSTTPTSSVTSLTPTSTPSVTTSPSTTPSSTPSTFVTLTSSATPTSSVTPSPSENSSPTPSATPTPSESVILSITPTPSVTSSSSVTPSPSVISSPSGTPSPSITPTSSLSMTPTASATPSESASPSSSMTASISRSPSRTPSALSLPNGTEAVLVLEGDVTDFDQALFIEELAALLGICPCRIIVISVHNVDEKQARTLVVNFHIFELTGEDSSTQVLINLQQQVQEATITIAGMTVVSVHVLTTSSQSSSPGVGGKDNSFTVTLTVIIVVGVFGVVTVISIACAVTIIHNRRLDRKVYPMAPRPDPAPAVVPLEPTVAPSPLRNNLLVNNLGGLPRGRSSSLPLSAFFPNAVENAIPQ